MITLTFCRRVGRCACHGRRQAAARCGGCAVFEPVTVVAGSADVADDHAVNLNINAQAWRRRFRIRNTNRHSTGAGEWTCQHGAGSGRMRINFNLWARPLPSYRSVGAPPYVTAAADRCILFTPDNDRCFEVWWAPVCVTIITSVSSPLKSMSASS